MMATIFQHLFLLFILVVICDDTFALVASPVERLRKVLTSSSTCVPLLGVHDALSSKIFAAEGAQVLFLSGFGVSACRLGQPDAGILSLPELEDTTRAVVSAASGVPVIIDGDTGFGGTANIRRTIRNLAGAGAAAISIEDQIFPKRCTYAAGSSVRVVSREESRGRIQTALLARDEAREIDGNDVLIIARTDCRAGYDNIQEVVERCKEYEKIGADIVYAENLQSPEEYVELRSALKETTPMMLAQVQLYPSSGENVNQQKLYTLEEMSDMGYSLGLFGVTALQMTVGSLQSVARHMLGSSSSGLITDEEAKGMASFDDLKNAIGFSGLDEFEEKLLHNSQANDDHNILE